MGKKVFKSLTLGVVVFVAAILVGYFAYLITYRYQIQKMQENMMPNDFVSATPAYREIVPTTGEAALTEYYLARLENNDIAIYTVAEDGVKFLYRLDIYTGNFPAEELLRLKNGVVLRNRRELASFEEDYTS